MTSTPQQRIAALILRYQKHACLQGADGILQGLRWAWQAAGDDGKKAESDEKRPS